MFTLTGEKSIEFGAKFEEGNFQSGGLYGLLSHRF